MDKRIYDKVCTQFTDISTFATQLNTQYITFKFEDDEYGISVNRNYIITVNGNYIAAGIQPDEVLTIIDFIVRGERYPISDKTRTISSITGFDVAY